MAIPVQMPKVGISVESCILTKWHKKKGDAVEKGEILFSYETDKTSIDEESQESGILLDIFYNEGDEVPVMQYVAVIGKAGEDYSQFIPKDSAPESATEKKADTQTAQSAPLQAADSGAEIQSAAKAEQGGSLKISPRALNLAKKTGVDYSQVSASGAEGRIIERDIAELAAKATFGASGDLSVQGTGIGGRVRAADMAQELTAQKVPTVSGADYVDEKITNVRKIIAKAMHESLSSMAQLTNNMSFDATNILNFRKGLKEKPELGLDGITINDIILYAVSRVLLKHKLINAHFLGDSMRYFNGAHIGIAVDAERGLLVPTLFNADKMSLLEISKAAKPLIKSAQQGTISPELLKGGTFTVTNLGALGVESFTPIINPPQTAILGVNTLVDAIKVEGGQIKPYKAMTLSLTYDHRAVDGAPAARFLKDVCTALENFSLYLAL